MSGNSQILTCYPIISNFNNSSIEGFQGTSAVTATQYNNSIIYKLGDFVIGSDGITYKMIDGIGAPGYPPPRPTNWEPVGKPAVSVSTVKTYSNSVIYNKGDFVIGPDNYTYEMIDGIGAAGYPPPRETNWKRVDMTNMKTETQNNIVQTSYRKEISSSTPSLDLVPVPQLASLSAPLSDPVPVPQLVSSSAHLSDLVPASLPSIFPTSLPSIFPTSLPPPYPTFSPDQSLSTGVIAESEKPVSTWIPGISNTITMVGGGILILIILFMLMK